MHYFTPLFIFIFVNKGTYRSQTFPLILLLFTLPYVVYFLALGLV